MPIQSTGKVYKRHARWYFFEISLCSNVWVFLFLKNIHENKNKNNLGSFGRKHNYSLLKINGWSSEVKIKINRNDAITTRSRLTGETTSDIVQICYLKFSSKSQLMIIRSFNLFVSFDVENSYWTYVFQNVFQSNVFKTFDFTTFLYWNTV